MNKNIISENIAQRAIGDFISRHNEIYIYGYGDAQKVFKEYYSNLGANIEGFIISDGREKKQNDVWCLGEILPKANEIGIIVAIQEKYYNDVIPQLLKKGFDISDIFLLDSIERNKIYVLYGKNEEYDIDDFANLKELYFEYARQIMKKCKADEYNMYCCRFELGDLVYVFRMKKQFEKKYNTRINYIITERQKVVAELCEVFDYIIVDKIKLPQTNLSKERMRLLELQMFETIFMNMPCIGIPFVVPFMIRIRILLNENTFCEHFSKWLGLGKCSIEAPKKIGVSKKFSERLNKIAPINNIVLMAPEANSMPLLDMNGWIKLAEKLKNKGFKVVTNCIDEKNHIPGTIRLEMSLQELFELGYNCHSVYSLRSGLCDCLSGRDEGLYVIYWSEPQRDYVSLEKNFVRCEATGKLMELANGNKSFDVLLNELELD